jgi:hypothetical protein
MTTPPNETRFTEDDLLPSPEERLAARKALAERIAAAVSALSAGVAAGGLLVLGLCAAPFVFRLTPAPFSGHAMGAAFARFDSIAIGATVLVLGGEVVRTWAAGRRGRTIAARIRRALAIVMALAAAYIGVALTPRINELHSAGVMRGSTPEGQELERIHRRAELAGRAEIVAGFALVILHVLTIPARRPEDDDDDDDAVAPLPPGPSE